MMSDANSETANSGPNATDVKSSSTITTIFLLLLLSGLAGGASWALAEKTGNLATIPLEISSKNYEYAELNAATIKVNTINGALVYGGLGLLLAAAVILALKLAGGLQGKLAFAGLILGALGGALPCLVVMPLHWQNRNDDPSVLDLTMPLVYHAGLWVPIGLAVGLVFGYSRFGSFKAGSKELVTGGIGALVGTLIYEFVGAALLPMDKTVEPVAATPTARLLAHLAVSLGIALSLAWSMKSAAKASRAE
jgi:hypothetical protein